MSEPSDEPAGAATRPRTGPPRIAIVGRPNVGKSTLLNRLVHSRVAIVEPTEGVTRDRIGVRTSVDTPWGERTVEVVDTGGIGIVDRDDLGPVVEEQVRVAVETADVVLFVVDARSGTAPLDHEVAARLRGTRRPVVLVVNKVESDALQWEVDRFRALGVGGEPLPISAQNGDGVSDLVERIVELLPPATPEEAAAPDTRGALKIAIVGRRNAGKSTLVNAWAREERMIVSEVPGTTRDAIDVVVERDGETMVLIDTAGVRRKKTIQDAIELYSDARSYRAVRRADVVVLLLDPTRPVAQLERKLARYVRDHHKPVVVAVNKWDLAGDADPDDVRRRVASELPGLGFAPIVLLSAKAGRGVEEVFGLCRDLAEEARHRVTTGELNRVLERALEARVPGSRGHRVRLRYATQSGVSPPTFVLFVNDVQLVGRDHLRYFENRLRAELPFERVPIRLVLRPSSAADERRSR